MRNLILIQIAFALVGCTDGFASKTLDQSTETLTSTLAPPPSPAPAPAPAPSPMPAPSPTMLSACGTPISGGIYVNTAPFNADATGVQDSTAAIQNAINCAHSLGVTTVVIPDGTFQIANENGLTLPAGMTLTGYGSARSKLVAAAGKLISNMISVSNQSHITINGIGFLGNSSVLNNNLAIIVSNDQGAATDVDGVTITNNSFENFRAQCWVCVNNYSKDVGTTNVTVSNNSFYSHDGNAINPSIIGYASAAIWFNGTALTPNTTAAHPNAGLLNGVTAQSNYFQIPNIKNAISVWSSTNNVSIASNIINGVGVAGDIPDNVGAYAILVYNNAYYYAADGSVVLTGGLDPNNIHVESNQLLGVHSAGVYMATVGAVYVQNNTITGQYDSQDVTIPKGAIALNGPKTAVVTGNTISNCLYGLELVERQDFASIISTQTNTIYSTRANGTGIKYQSFSGGLLQITNTYISLPSGGTAITTLNGIASTGTQQFSGIFQGPSDTGPFTQIY